MDQGLDPLSSSPLSSPRSSGDFPAPPPAPTAESLGKIGPPKGQTTGGANVPKFMIHKIAARMNKTESEVIGLVHGATVDWKDPNGVPLVFPTWSDPPNPRLILKCEFRLTLDVEQPDGSIKKFAATMDWNPGITLSKDSATDVAIEKNDAQLELAMKAAMDRASSVLEGQAHGLEEFFRPDSSKPQAYQQRINQAIAATSFNILIESKASHLDGEWKHETKVLLGSGRVSDDLYSVPAYSTAALHGETWAKKVLEDGKVFEGTAKLDGARVDFAGTDKAEAQQAAKRRKVYRENISAHSASWRQRLQPSQELNEYVADADDILQDGSDYIAPAFRAVNHDALEGQLEKLRQDELQVMRSVLNAEDATVRHQKMQVLGYDLVAGEEANTLANKLVEVTQFMQDKSVETLVGENFAEWYEKAKRHANDPYLMDRVPDFKDFLRQEIENTPGDDKAIKAKQVADLVTNYGGLTPELMDRAILSYQDLAKEFGVAVANDQEGNLVNQAFSRLLSNVSKPDLTDIDVDSGRSRYFAWVEAGAPVFGQFAELDQFQKDEAGHADNVDHQKMQAWLDGRPELEEALLGAIADTYRAQTTAAGQTPPERALLIKMLENDDKVREGLRTVLWTTPCQFGERLSELDAAAGAFYIDPPFEAVEGDPSMADAIDPSMEGAVEMQDMSRRGADSMLPPSEEAPLPPREGKEAGDSSTSRTE